MTRFKFRMWDKLLHKMIRPEHVDYYTLDTERKGLPKEIKNQYSLLELGIYGTDEWYPCCEAMILLEYFETTSKNNTIVLMQYTGVNDTNGVEIYEGDIVECPLVETQYIVQFHRGAFVLTPLDPTANTLSVYSTQCTVIGNIFESLE